MSDRERRVINGIEIRQEGGRRPRLVGWAAIWNSRSVDLGGFVEIIRPGAFTRSLRENQDMRAFVDHDPAMIIGRQSAGTLSIQEDSRGLRVEISPPDTQVGRDVMENIRVGNLDGMSFSFRLYDKDAGQRWDFKQDPPLREIVEAETHEVSVVAMPAYPNTEIALRSLHAYRNTMPTIQRLQERLERQRAAWR